MAWIHPEWSAHQRKRFMRSDADRYTRSDAYRWSLARDVDNAPFDRRTHQSGEPESITSAVAASIQAESTEIQKALARLRLDWELLKFESRGQKAGFNPDQPRDDRGRWADAFGDFRTYVAGMPRIPRQRPPVSGERTATYKQLAAWVKENGPAILGRIAKTSWLYPAIPTIWSYLDAPKTLEELQDDLSPKAGYDRHHIVEQTSAEEDGYPRNRIDDPDNVARIPRMKHWEITAWYNTRNERYGGDTPRDYLRDKDWDERRKVGLESMEKFGVLKR